MPMFAEVDTMLNDLSGIMSPEDIASLKEKLGANPKAQEYFKGGILRQSDFSRERDKLAKQITDIEKKESEIADLQTRLAAWKSDADTNLSTKSKKVEELETKIAKVTSRLSTLKDAYAISEEDLKDILESSTVETPVKPDSNLFTRQDFQTEATAFAKTLPRLSLELDDIRDEHRELFGKRLTKAEAESILEKAYASGGRQSIRQLWETDNKVSERRQQLNDEAYQKRLKSDVDAELTKRMSEMNLPGNVRRNEAPEGSQVFKLKRDSSTETQTHIQQPASYVNPGSTVSKAVSAYREGKYKNAA